MFLAAAAAIWWGLDRAERRVAWLRVEAPRRAVVGQPFRIRVYLAPLAEPGMLYADLHWSTSREKPMQYLTGASPKAAGKDGGAFDFDIMVAPREGLRFVMGVLYVSGAGGWSGHRLAASTKPVPAVSDAVAPGETRLEPLGMQPLDDPAAGHPQPAALPRLLTGLVLLAAMLAAWRPGRSTRASNNRLNLGFRWWQVLVVLLALASLWELLGLETWLLGWAREMARAEEYYHLRPAFQKSVISATAAATIIMLVLIWHVRKAYRLLLVSLALYLAIALVNLVSLHALDKVADISWHGLSLVQALKLVCATLILQSVRKARPV